MAEIRLLACSNCKTIEELEDYHGPEEQDHLLNHLISRHTFADGRRHFGALLRVDADEWKKDHVQKEITKQIAAQLEGGAETGLGSAFYDLKNTYQADALACFRQHNRNPACSDYHSDEKRLTPGTKEERRKAGLPEYRSPKDRYLCDFCPVHSLVEQAQREKQGAYK